MVLGDRMSASYTRRQELMRTLRVPTISEIKASLGLPLSLVVFEESTEALRHDIGLTPPLEGPVGELWLSPSDLLIDKVCLKPPFTQKHIQALTHQGILEIGAQIERKFWHEMEMERDGAIKEREDYLTRMFELEKHRAVETALEEQGQKRSEETETMRQCYEHKINELIWNCYMQVREMEESQAAEIQTLNVLWQQKLEAEIETVVQNITEEFLEKLRQQERILVSIFTKQINILKWKHKCALELEKVKSKEVLLQLRHHLECQNIANLMYVLCKERRKCKGERIELENYYKRQIKKLKTEIRGQANQIKNLTRLKMKRQKQLNVREKCLIEILRQFKKFIYFALKASPNQGEFLLNITKLLNYEIDDYCFGPEPPKEKEITTKPPVTVMDEKAALIETASSPKSEIEEFFKDNIASSAEDETEEEFEESDALPAFFFNEKMYVREDFRDRFFAGIEMDMTHPLWNKDVEELLNIFKQTVAEKRIPPQPAAMKSHPSSVHFHYEHSDDNCIIEGSQTEGTCSVRSPSPSYKSIPKSLKSQSPPSVSTKRSPSFEDDEYEIRKVSLAGSIDESKKSVKQSPKRASYSREMCSKSEEFTVKPKNINGNTQSKLVLARDSVILQLSTHERKSLEKLAKQAKMSPEKDDGEFLDETQFSELETVPKSVCSLDSKNESGSRPTSKIMLAQDSFELIKSTITIHTDKSDEDKTKTPVLSLAGDSVKPTKQASPRALKIKRPPPRKARRVTATSSTSATTSKAPKLVTESNVMQISQQSSQEFTQDRIKSLVKLMNENPSLIGLFTKCS